MAFSRARWSISCPTPRLSVDRGHRVRLLYFAWLRSKIGTAEEEFQLPPEVRDVNALINWLKARGPNYAEALKDPKVVRVAVNQNYVGPDHRICDSDEIAIFPPVTGG
jgi:sulfur-carrier protein